MKGNEWKVLKIKMRFDTVHHVEPKPRRSGPCDENTHSPEHTWVRNKVAARLHSGFEAQKRSHAIQIRLEFALEGAIARR